MYLRTVIVGIGHWEDLTLPFAESLRRHNPLSMVIIDNASKPPYPNYTQRVMRVARCGYGEALNAGAYGNWNWLLCANNDCTCTGNITEAVDRLRTDTVYGNAWKYDYAWMQELGLPAVVDSAYLLIPRKVWDVVGKFDPQMDAAFEEIDYGLRAVSAGFRLDVVDLPIVHLNLHTRKELAGYEDRWRKTSTYFKGKYITKGVQYV